MNATEIAARFLTIVEFTDEEIAAFQVAMMQGHIAVAQNYLARGMNVDAMGSGFQSTALYCTIHMRHYEGYLDWLKFLLDAGADPNHWQGEPESPLVPLCLAVGHNIFGAAQLLLQHGADPNIHAGNVLHVSAINPRVEMLQLLLDYGADYSIRDDKGKMPMDTFQEFWDYRKQTMPNFVGFENEALIRQMLSPHHG